MYPSMMPALPSAQAEIWLGIEINKSQQIIDIYNIYSILHVESEHPSLTLCVVTPQG